MIVRQSHGVGIALCDDIANTLPNRPVGEKFYDTTLVRKRGLLQYRKVFHQAVVNDIFHDLIHKVYLTAVQTGVIELY